MNALIKFHKGMFRYPTPVLVWLMVLVAANLAFPLLFLDRLEAQVVLVTFLASLALLIILTARFGFMRILGLGHILWIPLLVFLWSRLQSIPAEGLYGIWIRILMVLNGTSLVIDTWDVIRYLKGDRKEIVEGL